jgi:hypothetical protein
LGDFVLNGVSLDVRRKLRAELDTNRYLHNDKTTEALVNESTALDRFWHTGPHDVGYKKAMEVPTSTSTWWPQTSPREGMRDE